MSKIFVERHSNKKYVAIQDKKVIATGKTQATTAEKVHKANPNDPVLAERVRMTTGGSRDKWRRIF